MHKQLRKMREEEGFTLIELLIVIVILGVLAAIVVFSVSGITDKGNSAACKSDIAEVQTAAEAFYAQQTTTPSLYPKTWDDIVPKFLHQQVDASVLTVVFDGTGKTAPTEVGPNTVTATDPTGC